MASWDFSSVVEYERNGNSHNYKASGDHSDVNETLTDGNANPPDGTFTLGESISVDVGGTIYTGVYAGEYVSASDEVYVLCYKEDGDGNADTDIVYVFSTLGLTEAEADLPNVFDSGDLDTGEFTVCFAAGTMIATPDGEQAVEALGMGDLVLSAEGTPVAVKWIGRQTVVTRFRSPERLGLVRIHAGTLGAGLPHSDLTVTADHAVLVDGVLCHAGALVNGTTIARVPPSEAGDRFTVYHVETHDHEIIRANGAPCETFVDNVSRRTFENYSEFERLFGETDEMRPLSFPRATTARQIPERLRASLAA